MPIRWDALSFSSSLSSSFSAQFDDPFLGPGGMGTMETCFHGNKKTCGGIFYGDGRITQDPSLTPWKNPISGATPSPDVAPEIGLGDMDESEPEATIDEIEDMDMMNALAATLNVVQDQCLPFFPFPWMKNKEDCRPKVHLTPQEKKRMRASVLEGLYRFQKNKTCAAMLCTTSSTKSNKNKSWKMRHRYSRGANKKKRRGGLASKFHRQQRGATLQVQAALHRLHRLLR
jgi:hypothetical protein